MTQKFDMCINNSALIVGGPLALDYRELADYTLTKKCLVNNFFNTYTALSRGRAVISRWLGLLGCGTTGEGLEESR